jgi:hypothetical protein
MNLGILQTAVIRVDSATFCLLDGSFYLNVTKIRTATALCVACSLYRLVQWYSTFFVRISPDIISLQLCTPKVVGI